MSLDFSFLTLKVINNIILTGLIFSFKLTLIAMVLGIILGTLLAMMRLSKFKLLSSFALGYVTIVRSIPLVMVILWVFLLIPLFIGRSLGTEYSAIITFTLFEAAFYAEIMRAGIQSVKRDQANAGYALGMNYFQCMSYIVLPQAFRNMLPALGNDFISMMKDSSLLSVLAVEDLTYRGRLYSGSTFRFAETYLVLTVLYLCITLILSAIQRQIEKRLETK